MKHFLQILILLTSISTYGQYYADMEISKKNLTSWNVKSYEEYMGIYKLGFSDEECNFRLIISDTIIVAQIRFFTDDSTTGGFKNTFKTFTNVRIDGNKFYSDQTNGKFVFYKNEYNDSVAGLLVYNPWTYKISKGGEFGCISQRGDAFFVGKYIFASTRLLTEEELESYDLNELKIMRNEIFARYGFIFQKGGEMDLYFSKQDWYRANYEKIDQWLTVIELKNIEVIKKVEKSK